MTPTLATALRLTLAILLLGAHALVPGAVAAQSRPGRAAVAANAADKAALRISVDSMRSRWSTCAKDIWDFAEVGYQEERSSARLLSELRAGGFEIRSGVAEIPTAFVASFGSGRPVIGILAEFDALPSLSQQAVPEKRPVVDGAPGHGCGHHLFGTASVAAGVAVRNWLAASGAPGTIRVYGTPAEEGGGGKVYMVRAGLFADVDAVLAWHPGDENNASPESTLANLNAKFRFRGLSAHAAGAPEQGRSALDGVEAMTHMINLMREHVPQETRMHYVITRGGTAPNVVPDFAEVYVYARHPEMKALREIWGRIVKASEGAALGTGTSVSHEVIAGVYNKMPNDALARIVDRNLREVGGYEMTPDERAFAEAIQRSLAAPRPIASTTTVAEFRAGLVAPASSDVGDVSWNVPTAELNAATWVPGTPAHSWQAVAAGGTSIGTQGMMVAAKTIASAALDLFRSPEALAAARAELERRRGAGFVYAPLLGDRKPALDYRR